MYIESALILFNTEHMYCAVVSNIAKKVNFNKGQITLCITDLESQPKLQMK